MIAYLTSRAEGGYIGILYPRSERKTWRTESGPNLDWSDGERAPLWSKNSREVYAGDGKKVYALDLERRAYRTLAEAPDWSFQGFFASPLSHRGWPTGEHGFLVASGPEGKTGFWRVSESGADLKLMETYQGSVSSSPYRAIESPDSRRLIFYTWSVKNPGNIWSYDIINRSMTQVVEPNPFLELEHFGERKIISWETSDGRTLHGVLLLPPEYKGGPLPTVLWVYGGTEGTSSLNAFGLEYSSVFNFEVLASRGYAVFRPEIPIRAGHQMEDINKAVLSAVDTLIEQGYSDPDRLAVMGQSYGSYTVLCLLVQSQRFKAAVLTASVLNPDLYAAYMNSPASFEDGQGNIGASPWEKPELYYRNSPYFVFDRITTPILMGQGSEDSLEIAEGTFRALESLNKDVELRIYDMEDHVISDPSNVVDFWRRRLEFLELHLGKTPR